MSNSLIFLLFLSFFFDHTIVGCVNIDHETKIQSSDIEAGDEFGRGVDISGDYAIVGALREDTGGSAAGAAYIFKRTGPSNWDAGTKIQASDKWDTNYFGASVGIDGDYVIVGAYNNLDMGAAYIFKRTGDNSWDGGTKIQGADIQQGDRFGCSVSIDGDYAIVGSHYHESNTGASYIFKRTGDNTWDAGVKIQAADKETNNYFGYRVDISGDYVIVGAYGEATGGIDTGAVYIYKRTGDNTWDTGTKIQAFDKAAADYFGYEVSIDGNYVIVGAFSEDTGGPNVGAAYIYKRTGDNTWDTGTKIQAPDKETSDQFGCDVRISDRYAIVGANFEDGTNRTDAGAAYIFTRFGNSWDTGTKIQASDSEDYDHFGGRVSIEGDYAIVGAFGEDTGGDNAGAAYIFAIRDELIHETNEEIVAIDIDY